ncbi:MAG: peptidoglycan DD-metalloendopeptidase family protein, partial [Spirochaetia bacterium]|nr:peptidoglycan DD-metalloendopeptidase family protein [Spirochaetia bacterium]
SGKYQYIEDNAYQTVSSRYSGERTMLYAHGSPVAINRSSGTRGYLGTDILGSTRSVTDNHGVQESYYDYDIFGSPVAGDFTTGTDYGYLGKPYDSITGLYNYGYRDYSPQSVRFTTVDPIRDGSNWFAYVNNDPVNYVDLWGLRPTYGATSRDIDVPNVEYQWPTTEGRITSAFGSREDAVPNPHPGIDIAPMTPGQKGQDILSAENGTVIIVGMSAGGSSEIHIEHTNGEVSIYKHHDVQSVQVKVGDGVYKGEKIAEMSDVGSPGAVHLHFEIRPGAGLRQKDAIDPVPKLPDIPATIHLTEAVERSGNTLKNK